MQSIVALHMADTHLGYRQYGLFERELDIYHVFEEAVELAIKEHVDIVIHSGDFFDTSRPPPQALRTAIRALRRLRDAGIPFVTVLGDHDIPKRRGDYPLSILEDLGLAHVLGLTPQRLQTSMRTRSGSEVIVAGLYHHKKSARDKLLAKLRMVKPPDGTPSILILHQGLEGYVFEPELSVAELPRGFSYYALGHVHKPEIIQGDGVIAAYPGSIDALRMDEARYEHGVILVEVDARNAYPMHIKLSSRPQLFYIVDYERIESELRRIAREITRHELKPLLHLMVRGKKINRKEVYRLVQALIMDKVLYVNVKFDEVIEESGIDINEEKGLDLLELLEKRLGDAMLARLAEEILEKLRAGAREVEIEALVEEYFRKRYAGDKQ